MSIVRLGSIFTNHLDITRNCKGVYPTRLEFLSLLNILSHCLPNPSFTIIPIFDAVHAEKLKAYLNKTRTNTFINKTRRSTLFRRTLKIESKLFDDARNFV
jgi:hypothetical protein